MKKEEEWRNIEEKDEGKINDNMKLRSEEEGKRMKQKRNKRVLI